MRDTASQLSDGLHLLRLAERLFSLSAFGDLGFHLFFKTLVELVQPLFGHLSLGDVNHGADKARTLDRIEERASARGNPAFLSVLDANRAIFDVVVT